VAERTGTARIDYFEPGEIGQLTSSIHTRRTHVNWLLRLLIGGNVGFLAKTTPAYIGWSLIAAAGLALGNVVIGSSHYRAFRSKSGATGLYLLLQFGLSALVIMAVAFAIRSAT
jgi:hypothetical protein